MRSSRTRGLAILVALTTLLAIAPSSVSALTLHRAWSAKIGSNGSNGTIGLRVYTNDVGTIQYSLRGLRTHATYAVQIRAGTCSSAGTIVARPPSVVTSSAGTVAQTDTLLPWLTTRIWPAARSSSFIVRLINGNSVACGGLTFTHATRVSVAGLGIDLPVVRGASGYPLCRVAMYLASIAQPREPGITFIYAHARRGMFLPLLTRYRSDGGRSLIGRTVAVWTSDSYVTYYRIVRVRKTNSPMVGAYSLTRERLWLQTSTGPNYTYAKLIIEASRYRTVKSTYAAAHPTPHAVRC